jgi:hypothetical protein
MAGEEPKRRLTDEEVEELLKRLPEFAELPPARRYVAALLLQMFKKGVKSLRLAESERLPVISFPCPMPNELFKQIGFRKVVSRLKEMSGLAARSYEHPKDGGVELNIDNTLVTARIHFDEKCENPYCEIVLEPADSTTLLRTR